MNTDIKTIMYGIIVAAGIGAFFLGIPAAGITPASIVSIYSAVVFFLLRKRDRLTILEVLLPLGTGNLSFLISLFYWDRVDHALRLNNLLIIALFFSAMLLLRECRTLSRFLDYFNGLPLKKRLLLIFIGLEIVFVLASVAITQKNVTLIGDEAHYFLISQSIVNDGDLNVANQYYDKQYKEYLDIESLGIHGFYGKWDRHFEGPKPGTPEEREQKKGHYIYSIHLPGISFTLAPFFLFKWSPAILFILTRAFIGLFAAGLGIFIYLIALKLWNDRSLALFIIAVFSLTTPIFFHSIHIYPEIQIMLLVAAAIYLLVFHEKKSTLTVLLAGLLLSLLIFWGVKYAIYMYLFSAGFFVYFIIKKRYSHAVLLVIFPIISQLLFFLYLYNAYGNLSPMSVYMNAGQKKNFVKMITEVITMKMRGEALLDYFFDQKDGLLLYNPFYFFAFPGLILAFKNFKKYIFHILIALPAGAFVFNYAFLTHRGGYCPQARPLVPVMWILMMFAVIYLKESNNQPFRKLFYYLPLYSLFVTIYQVLHPFTIYQATTSDNPHRAGLLFQQWSNLHLRLPELLPSFVKVPDNHLYLPNAIALLIFIILITLSLMNLKARKLKPLTITVFFVVISIFAAFPQISRANPTLVDRSDVIPHRIYNVSPHPARRPERIFACTAAGRYSYTISTFKPAPYIVIDIENLSAERASIEARNFDDALEPVEIRPNNHHTIVIDTPSYQKVKNAYYYQFHLDITAGHDGGQPPDLRFQIYPSKRSKK